MSRLRQVNKSAKPTDLVMGLPCGQSCCKYFDIPAPVRVANHQPHPPDVDTANPAVVGYRQWFISGM
jgi:hypothetical protein